MATDLEASRLMVRHGAKLITEKAPNYTMYCAMAKKFATDKCFDIVNDALQLHGGYGYLADFPVEKYYRDARILQIYEGTSEVQKLLISRGNFL